MSKKSLAFGKQQEFAAMAKLIGQGYDVYQTLVDDKGVDCVVRISPTKYWDVQVKARSKDSEYNTLFSAMSITPRDNCVFVFYTEVNDTYWVIPSRDVVKLAIPNQRGKNRGKYSLRLPKSAAKPGRFARYRNSFAILGR